MAFNRIAIMGAGSLGTILGAYITKGGRQIDLIDANKAHVDALNKDGATVIGTVNINVPVKALTPDEMEGKYDLFLYLAKQTYNDTAVPQMVNHLADNGVICTLQNGIPEPEIAKYIGEDRTMGCTVGWGATWIKPGVSEATTTQANWVLHLGRIDGKITDELKEVQSILELMCPTHLTETLMNARWTKLVCNCAFSGMSAVLGCTFGEVLDDPKAVKCAEYIGRECIRVTHALGYTMEEIAPGIPFEGRIDFHNEDERNNLAYPIYEAIYGSANRASIASMLQDIQKGKKTEVMAIDGVLSKFGKETGVPTPVTDKVVEIILGIEEGKYKPEFKNLDMFTVFEA